MSWEVLNKVISENNIENYIRFALILGAWLIVILILKAIIRFRKKKALFSNPESMLYIVLQNIVKYIAPLFYIFAIYSALKILRIHPAIVRAVDIIWVFSLVFFMTRFVLAIVSWVIQNFWKNKEKGEANATTIVLLTTIVKVLVWAIAILIFLDNMGVKISGLIAGVGIGGVAIAFASQTILGDVFNYFTIFFDKPFEIGDYIVIDEHRGYVEHIGLKSTRIKSLSGEELVFSNTDLTNSRVRNFKRMTERRATFSFSVTYQTPVNTLRKISELVKQIIEEFEDTRFDRAHFHKFGDSSLDFEVVYYVKNNSYVVYMDIQQEINLKLMQGLKKLKVNFAHPIRTVVIDK